MLSDSQILQSVLEKTQEGIVILSTDCKVIRFNKILNDIILDLSGKEIQVGVDYRDCVSEQNKKLFSDTFVKACKGETILSAAMTEIPGLKYHFEYQFNPIFDKSHLEVVAINFSIRKISKENEEEKIQQLTETINSIFINSSECYVILDKNLTLLNFNKMAFEKLKANSGKEIYIGCNFKTFIYDGRENIFTERYERALKGEHFVYEEAVLASNGKTNWVNARIQPIYRNDGEILGISVFWNYITERKLAEMALQESEEKFRRIVDASPVPIIITDEKLNIVLKNRETRKTFGYKPGELLSKNIRKLLPKTKNNNSSDYLKKNFIKTALTKNGDVLFVEVGLSKFYVNNKKFYIIIIQNITQRVYDDKLISDQIKKLESISWNHSHVIRRPLANILGAYKLLQLTDDETEKHQYINLLYESTIELDLVVQDIVNTSMSTHLS